MDQDSSTAALNKLIDARFPGISLLAWRDLADRDSLRYGELKRWVRLRRKVQALGDDRERQRRFLYEWFVDSGTDQDHIQMYDAGRGYAHDLQLWREACAEVELAYWYVGQLLPESIAIQGDPFPLRARLERPPVVTGASDPRDLFLLACQRGLADEDARIRLFAFHKLRLAQFEFERLREGLGNDALEGRERWLLGKVVTKLFVPESERRVYVRAELDPEDAFHCKSWRIVPESDVQPDAPRVRYVSATCYDLRTTRGDIVPVLFMSRVKRRVCLKALLKGVRFARDVNDLIGMRFVIADEHRRDLVDRMREVIAACLGQVIDQSSNDDSGGRLDESNDASSRDYQASGYILLVRGFKHEVRIQRMAKWLDAEFSDGPRHVFFKIRRLRKIAHLLFPNRYSHVPWDDGRLWEAALAV